MYSLVQIGVDTYYLAKIGCLWPANGGHAHVRKWAILFAGFMLNDSDMLAVGQETHTMSAWRFGEDEQTFYVSQTDIDRGVGYTQDDLGEPEWGIRHYAEPNLDNPAWTANYRQCCTAICWSSEVLGALILGLKDNWNWPALFDYQDRYNATETTYLFGSQFSREMWLAYRSNYP
jgi:hypothetical protein